MARRRRRFDDDDYVHKRRRALALRIAATNAVVMGGSVPIGTGILPPGPDEVILNNPAYTDVPNVANPDAGAYGPGQYAAGRVFTYLGQTWITGADGISRRIEASGTWGLR